MIRRTVLRVWLSTLAIFVMLVNSAAAQTSSGWIDRPTLPTSPGQPPPDLMAGVSADTRALALAPGEVGKPGLSFRYAGERGEVLVPYFTDNEHINRGRGLAIDPANNALYVTEEQGNRVLKFNASGDPVWSIGNPGHSEHSTNTFSDPHDVALDPAKNVWVADWSRVMQFDSNGGFLRQMPSVDPWGEGDEHGRFRGANGIAFDSAGRMYVSDMYNHRIEVFTFDTNGDPVYYRTIGTGQGSGSNQFDEPHRIAVDAADALYVADSRNNRVQKCIYNSAGETWDCSTFQGGLTYPNGVETFGSDVVYIANTDASNIWKCVSGTCAHFLDVWTMDIAVDSSGNVYTTTPWEHSVHRWSSTGIDRGVFVGEPGVPYWTDLNHFFRPSVSVDPDNNLVVIEEAGQRLLKKKSDGTLVCSIGVAGISGDAQDGLLNWPKDIAYDSNKRMYVTSDQEVRIYDSNCNYLTRIGPLTGVSTGDTFSWVTGVAVGPDNKVYVSDTGRQRITIYTPTYQYVGMIGQTNVCGQSTNPVQFCGQRGLTTDAAGNLYVADKDNGRVLKINPNRQVVFQLGRTQDWGESNDRFSGVSDVTVDAAGRIYAVDSYNNRVQVFDTTGSYLTTIGGGWGSNTGEFRNVSGVAIGPANTVYVADQGNARVKLFKQGVPGWKQINVNGFGDRWMNPSALETFGGQLYAAGAIWGGGLQMYRTSDGTNWSAVGSRGFNGDSQNAAVLDLAVYKSKLYAATGWSDNHGQIWRSDDGSYWERVAVDGFSDNENLSFHTFVVFNDELYVSTWAQGPTHGFEIFRTSTGNEGDWTQVHSESNLDDVSITAWGVFGGYLYAGVENTDTGLKILRSNNGSTWDTVKDDGFGSVNNVYASGFANLNGELYVSTVTYDDSPGQIWKTGDGLTWTQVPTAPFSLSRNYSVFTLTAFKGSLYAFPGHSQGLQVWKSNDGTNWVKVNEDGFGDSGNSWSGLAANQTAIFKGALVKGVWSNNHGGQVWMLVDQTAFLPVAIR